MNTAAEILSLFDSLGVTIRINERGNLAVRPTDRVTPDMARRVKAVEPDMRRLLRQRDAEPLGILSRSIEMPDRVIEATFGPATARVREQPINPAFPPCPDCKTARYWITPSGKVVCSKCGEVCFLLTSITYHAVN